MKRRSEQKIVHGLVGCLVILAIVFVSYVMLHGKSSESASLAESTELTPSASLATSQSDEGQPSSSSVPKFFDPNTADSATLVAVGLSSFQARNVLRYRQKGGQYHRPEDFKRLYGLTVQQWEQIVPHIRIGRQYQYLADVEDVNSSYSRPERLGGGRGSSQMGSSRDSVRADFDTAMHATHPFRSNEPRNKLRKGEFVDLANCDTTELKRVPGIGSYYARRIAEYAEKLGGFVSVKQLNDEALSFLPADVDQYLTLKTPSVRKLRINELTVRELVRHPYITYPQAKQIVDRVRLNGPFRTLDEVIFLSEFTETDRRRLEPYVAF